MPHLPPVSIRPCTSGDLAAIKQITAEAFDGISIDQAIQKHHGPVASHDWRWHKLRHLDHDFEAGMIAVAEDDAGTAIGYISMRIDHAAKTGSIPNLAVHADHRGSGIGRHLLEHALEVFRTKGLAIARIETLVQNQIGSTLYPKLGFKEVAKQAHFAKRL